MDSKLNGWRRIAVSLFLIWLAIVGGVITMDILRNTRIFVVKGLPKGTIVKPDRAILPDGSEVKINGINPENGERLKPWEIDWKSYPELRTEREVNWVNISIAVFLPILLWSLAEVLVVNFRWISNGFKK
jgi:hypothetical protein